MKLDEDLIAAVDRLGGHALHWKAEAARFKALVGRQGEVLGRILAVFEDREPGYPEDQHTALVAACGDLTELAGLLAAPDGAAALAELEALREGNERARELLAARRSEAAEWRSRAHEAEGAIASCADLINTALRETQAAPEITIADLRPGIKALWWGLNQTKGELAELRVERDKGRSATQPPDATAAAEFEADALAALRAQLAEAEELLFSAQTDLHDSRIQLAEKEAALVAAGEALQHACENCEHCFGKGEYSPGRGYKKRPCDECADFRSALSAPALARAVGLDRARRELADAVEAFRHAKESAWRNAFAPDAEGWLRQTTAEAAMLAAAARLRALESKT